MKVTGQRVSSARGGFNAPYQRHAASYALCAPLLGPGRVLDVGCGVGHSYRLLGPRETVGVDVEPAVLTGQDRETVLADMRKLPFDDASFSSVLLVHSVEHVPDPELAIAEAERVLEPGGLAVFITPNRLTFGRPDEIIDPYHYVELDPEELRRLCEASFPDVAVRGLFASELYMELFNEERAKLDRLLAKDPLKIRRLLPRALRKMAYDMLLRHHRPAGDRRAEALGIEDFELRSEEPERSLDLFAFCSKPG